MHEQPEDNLQWSLFVWHGKMAAKPIISLELRYTMIQFLIISGILKLGEKGIRLRLQLLKKFDVSLSFVFSLFFILASKSSDGTKSKSVCELPSLHCHSRKILLPNDAFSERLQRKDGL